MMNNNLKNILIIVIILSILAGIKIILDKKYYTSSTLLFNYSIDEISKFEIYNTIDTIMIVRTNKSWKIFDNDTLEIIENKITDFSNQVLKIEKETLISSNVDNWGVYSVDDSTGIHLMLYNQNNSCIKSKKQTIRRENVWSKSWSFLRIPPKLRIPHPSYFRFCKKGGDS